MKRKYNGRRKVFAVLLTVISAFVYSDDEKSSNVVKDKEGYPYPGTVTNVTAKQVFPQVENVEELVKRLDPGSYNLVVKADGSFMIKKSDLSAEKK